MTDYLPLMPLCIMNYNHYARVWVKIIHFTPILTY